MAENSNIPNGDTDVLSADMGGDQNTPSSPIYTIVNGATDDQTASLKRSLFGLDTSPATYPTGTYWFGTESAQQDFVIPMARFKFYTPFGDDISLSEGASSPELYIRMPGSFNSTLINSYATTQGIFGSPLRGLEGNTGYDILKLIQGIGSSALGSLQSQVLNALTGGAGFVGSAGLNTRGQIEFLTRRAINNYNQVLYQGPQYRNFQLPFSMKPSSVEESNNMKAIIYCFRLASSPRADNEPTELDTKILQEVEQLAASGDVQAIQVLQQQGKTLTAEQQQTLVDYQIAVGEITDNSTLNLARQTDVLTLGYPDMCKFQIVLVDAKNKSPLITLFKSDFCVISSVAVDYGSGNKMSFFNDYMPTEATLSLALQEMSLPTAGSVANQFNNIQ